MMTTHIHENLVFYVEYLAIITL